MCTRAIIKARYYSKMQIMRLFGICLSILIITASPIAMAKPKIISHDFERDANTIEEESVVCPEKKERRNLLQKKISRPSKHLQQRRRDAARQSALVRDDELEIGGYIPKVKVGNRDSWSHITDFVWKISKNTRNINSNISFPVHRGSLVEGCHKHTLPGIFCPCDNLITIKTFYLEPVFSIFSGFVSEIRRGGYGEQRGFIVSIRADDGKYISYYDIGDLLVTERDRIAVGQPLGRVRGYMCENDLLLHIMIRNGDMHLDFNDFNTLLLNNSR